MDGLPIFRYNYIFFFQVLCNVILIINEIFMFYLNCLI
jgi:hypothetical protein